MNTMNPSRRASLLSTVTLLTALLGASITHAGDEPGWKKHVVHTGFHTNTAVAADFTGDGKPDVITNSGGKTRLFVAPDWKEIVLDDNPKHNCIHSATFDVDGDGDPDVIEARYNPGLVFWLECPDNPLTDRWRLHLIDDQIHGIHGVIAGDIDGDGKLDLLANSAQPKSPFPNSLAWLRVPKKPRAAARWERTIFADGDAPGLSHYLGFGDVNGDGRVDAASAAKGGPTAKPGEGDWFAWWEAPKNPRQRGWKKHLIADNQPGATNIHPADVNGDGKMDFIASRGHGKGVIWFEGPTWKMHEIHPTLAGPHCLVVIDMDGDGDIDAATCAKDDQIVAWFENDGHGKFTTHIVGRNQAAYDIRAVDMNGDGSLDLLVAGQASKNVVWYQNPKSRKYRPERRLRFSAPPKPPDFIPPGKSSMSRKFIFAALAVFAAFASSLSASEPLDLGGVTEKHVMVPMRDGTKLSVYLYFPKEKGPHPVLCEQRYANLQGRGTRLSMAKLASAGYVVAAQNYRGAQLSEGRWVGYRALGWGEQQDGYDTIEWLAKQPWSTGKVGTFGSSQAGYAQNFLAITQPPHLVCQYMIDTGLSLFHEGYRIGGTTRPERFKGMDAVCRVPQHNRDLLSEWFKHPTYDNYWADENCARYFDKMNVPCFTVGSWYDFMCQGSVESYVGRQHQGGRNSRGTQQLYLGPWLHGRYNKGNKTGEMVYPDNAAFDMPKHMVRWFDHFLKGVDNGVEREPTVRYYVMGAVGEEGAPGNVWRKAKDWPISTTETSYFLREKGKASTSRSADDESATTFLADPLNPASIPGRSFSGARDARNFEKQAEVRTFTTDVLEAPVEWTGKVQAELFVSSSAPDTDFIVRISDVYPDGRSILIVDYIRRARYRNSFETETFMEPGNVYKVAFQVGWMSQIFNRGHRIRVTIASTGAPFFEPNPNTGKPLTIEFPKKTVVARNTVHHNKRHASRIIAPVVKP